MLFLSTRLAPLLGGSPLRNGLVAQFNANESGGTLIDSVTGTQLTAVNTPTSGTGKISGARVYGGSNQYHTVADGAYPSAWDFAGAFSGSCWVNRSADQAGAILGVYDSVANERQWVLERVMSAGWRLMIFSTSNSNNIGSLSHVGSTETWYHLRWKFVPAAGMYLGVDNGPWTFTSYTGDIKSSTTAPFRVGARGNAANFFAGSIDCIKLWNRELSDAEFTLDYNGGSGVEL